jgi:hypothetical protein
MSVMLNRTAREDLLGVVYAELEASRAPFNKVERRLGLESRSGSRAVARNDVTTVEKGNSHVLPVAGIADDHLVVGLKACPR